MTSISATSANTYQSPLQRLQDQLQSEVNSGAISSSDQDALSSALTDIDSSLQASRASDESGGAPPSPADIKSRIDGLINGEVESGALTQDQATELQGVFKAAFSNGADGTEANAARGADGAHHGHHHGGGGGHADADAKNATSGSNSTSDLMQQFLQSLQNSQSSSSPTSYGATGTASTDAPSDSFAALLLDYKA